MRLAFLAAALCLTGCITVTPDTPGTNNPIVDDAYQSCDPSTDTCSQGTDCLDTTLPASAGYTGSLCTVPCGSDADCPQDLTNYAAICVNEQCYIQCPNGGIDCPYGTGCVTFSDQAGDLINICTP